MLSQEKIAILTGVLSPLQPSRIGVFGSYARNEQKPDSDLDILVSFYKTVNLLDLAGIEQELSEKPGVKVDLITEKSLHPRLRSHIEKDLIILKQ
jgi:predicted nucleotidyltransferase